MFGGKAHAAVPPDNCFSFDSGTGTIQDYYDYEDNNGLNPACPRNLDIPSAISGTAVTQIGSSSLGNKQLTSLTLPNTLLAIRAAAVRYNLLTTVTIPDSVTIIEGEAFRGNDLTSLTLSNSVVSIGSNAFSENQLTNVTIPNSVTTIEDYSFTNNYLASITLGNSVTTIGEAAFQGNQLTNVTIPNSVTTMDPTVFFLNSNLDYQTVLTLLQSGDSIQAQQGFDSIRLVRLFTADISNPNNLQDSIVTEAAFGIDFNANGNLDDVLGGHLINPTVTDSSTDASTNSSSVALAATGQSIRPIFVTTILLALLSIGAYTLKARLYQ